jgi:hypothetical protein
MQQADQHERYRLAEVQCQRGPSQDQPGIPRIGLEVGGRSLRIAGQQGLGVQKNDRVIVDVDDPRRRRSALRDLMGVVRGGMPVPMSRNWRMPASAAR